LVPELDGPIYKEIFTDICLLLSAPDFLIMIDPAQIAWAL
jgi:CO dehydrogenase/acetyl-CoA synthase delta subunit